MSHDGGTLSRVQAPGFKLLEVARVPSPPVTRLEPVPRPQSSLRCHSSPAQALTSSRDTDRNDMSHRVNMFIHARAPSGIEAGHPGSRHRALTKRSKIRPTWRPLRLAAESRHAYTHGHRDHLGTLAGLGATTWGPHAVWSGGASVRSGPHQTCGPDGCPAHRALGQAPSDWLARYLLRAHGPVSWLWLARWVER